MTRRLLAVLGVGFLALALPAYAQQGGTVNGAVVDESNAALPGANVTLTGHGPSKYQTTGGDGKYSFANVAPGSYKLTVSLPGFGTITQDVSVTGAAAEIPPITLQIALRGEEVVVTASKVESSLVNAPATMTVVGADTIASSPAQNYGDLLRSVPGLNVIQTSARDINITSRQSTNTLSNSQLALLDGRSIYLDFFGLILWDLVPSNPADIKQIEVVRGPASAVWGANALTGVINIITKTPREAKGTSLTLSGGFFDRDAGDTAGEDSGKSFGVNFTHAGAPNDTWSYRLSAGYFDSDAYARPTGTIPASTHPLDSSIRTGGGSYGQAAFENSGTQQPKVDLRLDQELGNGGRITYSGGYAGSEGIVHTGIGPFDLRSKNVTPFGSDNSYFAYGRIGYTKGGLKLAAFGNFLDGKAPNLLLRDVTGNPLLLNFKTQTFDLEVGYTHVVADRHILSYGGNARRNNFDITIAPHSEDRNEFGGYFQDEIFFDKFRFTLGGRVDKFGNLEDAVFSPRISAMFKPSGSHSFRVSFNKAFRSPSTINNYLETTIVTLQDIRPLGAAFFAQLAASPATAPLVPLLRPFLEPQFSARFPLVTAARGSNVRQVTPAGDLKEESLTAYEIGYTGTFARRTTVGFAFYINDTDDNINFIGDPCDSPYGRGNVPPGWPRIGPPLTQLLPASVVAQLQGGINSLPDAAAAVGRCLPAEFTYRNIGPIRNKGFEASIEHSFSRDVSGFVNYSWQDDPEVLDPDSGQLRYPTGEITLAPHNRFNIGINLNQKRFIGNATLTYTDKAFWTDVLTPDFFGYSDSYNLLNGSFGVKFADGKVTTSIKATNILNEDIQQHIFGDILKRSVTGEIRFQF